MDSGSSTAVSDISIVEVHTPHTSFAIAHSFAQDTLQSLFAKLEKKHYAGELSEEHSVGPGWLKYEWNDSVWNLDDDSDYSIFSWRQRSKHSSDTKGEGAIAPSCVMHMHNPSEPLPTPPAYCNPSYYTFRRPKSPPSVSHRSKKLNGRAGSVRSRHSGMSDTSLDTNGIPKHKKEFIDFHNANGVRTIIGSIGLVKDVRMLLKKGYRHVYISRSFAKKHGFIPKDAAPGLYGYGGLVNIGKWPITVGRTKTSHSVYLSEETHFDCILGRSFMEQRSIKTDLLDPTNIVCMDTGEKLDVELVIIRDGNGEIVTVT